MDLISTYQSKLVLFSCFHTDHSLCKGYWPDNVAMNFYIGYRNLDLPDAIELIRGLLLLQLL